LPVLSANAAAEVGITDASPRPGDVTGQLNGSSKGGLSGGVTAGTAIRRPGDPPGRRMQSRDQMLVSAVQKKLEKSGFCREGYKERYRMTRPGRPI